MLCRMKWNGEVLRQMKTLDPSDHPAIYDALRQRRPIPIL